MGILNQTLRLANRIGREYVKSQEQQRRLYADHLSGDYLYIIGVEWKRGSPVKIGRAADPDARLRNLQTAYPDRLQVLLRVHGGAFSERYVHRRFAQYRIRDDGEWFRFEGELENWVDHIEAMLHRFPKGPYGPIIGFEHIAELLQRPYIYPPQPTVTESPFMEEPIVKLQSVEPPKRPREPTDIEKHPLMFSFMAAVLLFVICLLTFGVVTS